MTRFAMSRTLSTAACVSRYCSPFDSSFRIYASNCIDGSLCARTNTSLDGLPTLQLTSNRVAAIISSSGAAAKLAGSNGSTWDNSTTLSVAGSAGLACFFFTINLLNFIYSYTAQRIPDRVRSTNFPVYRRLVIPPPVEGGYLGMFARQPSANPSWI